MVSRRRTLVIYDEDGERVELVRTPEGWTVRLLVDGDVLLERGAREADDDLLRQADGRFEAFVWMAPQGGVQ